MNAASRGVRVDGVGRIQSLKNTSQGTGVDTNQSVGLWSRRVDSVLRNQQSFGVLSFFLSLLVAVTGCSSSEGISAGRWECRQSARIAGVL